MTTLRRLGRDLAQPAVIGLMVGAWTAVGVAVCFIPASGAGVIGTGIGCAFVGAVITDIINGRI
jgi:ABC-type enterobactin transport system permease subunit